MYEKKVIAFIDILGFKNMVQSPKSKKNLDEILDILEDFSLKKHYPDSFHGLCPNSQKEKDDFDIKITQISDSLIISSEFTMAGIINLIYFSHRSLFRLLSRGLLCRGYITIGEVYHEKGQIIGEGYIKAYEYESKKNIIFSVLDGENVEKGTPFVEIDKEIVDYIVASNDECVKEMLNRLTKTINGKTALYPLQILAQGSTPEIFDSNIDILEKFKKLIEKHTDNQDEKIEVKSKQHLKIIDDLIKENIQAKRKYDLLNKPYPLRTVQDLLQEREHFRINKLKIQLHQPLTGKKSNNG
ncbi:MAG: hypothetical protein RBR23_09785 [Arcobacteraceae bacterium]|jgi:hypothetical protein|nr:hypothetical protein [Arcobacteraceae bacterium]